MLPCSGDDLAVSHDSDPLGDDVLATVGGHLDVHSSTIVLKVGWHFGVPIPIADAADFSLTGVDGAGELVDASSSFSEALVGDGGASPYGGDEAMCNGVCCVGEVVVLQAEEGLS